MTPADDICQLCGHTGFVHADVLWPELIDAWQLTPDESAYINIQQGTSCERCAANVRSQALARALLTSLGAATSLADVLETSPPPAYRILEINEAGALTPWLSKFPGHVLARYPECDMTRMSFASESFDFVVHSDTLEHVANFRAGLLECARVLVPGGNMPVHGSDHRQPDDAKPSGLAAELSRARGLPGCRFHRSYGVWRGCLEIRSRVWLQDVRLRDVSLSVWYRDRRSSVTLLDYRDFLPSLTKRYLEARANPRQRVAEEGNLLALRERP